MGYDAAGMLSAMAQSVRSPDTGAMITREQSFAHRADTTVSSATHDGLTTTYGRSPAGWTESMTAERRPGASTSSSFSYNPAGLPTATSLGSGTATSVRTYTPDAMVASLVWSAGGTTVRSHTGLAYDFGGLRTGENVAVTHPTGAVGADPGGLAGFSYDLAGRLVSYTSPYKLAPTDTAEPSVAYSLDDGANIAGQTTRVGDKAREEASTYSAGRLTQRTWTTATGSASTFYNYSPLGEEIRRYTSQSTVVGSKTVSTSYDPAGHVKLVDEAPTYDNPSPVDVDYVYDGSDHVLSRRAGNATTLYPRLP